MPDFDDILVCALVIICVCLGISEVFHHIPDDHVCPEIVSIAAISTGDKVINKLDRNAKAIVLSVGENNQIQVYRMYSNGNYAYENSNLLVWEKE